MALVLVLCIISSLFLEEPASKYNELKVPTIEASPASSQELTSSIPKCDHEFKPATCTEPRSCEICLQTVGTALGHNWKNATCKAPKTCTKCGRTEGEKSGHNYYNGYCSDCNAKDPDFGELETHIWQVLKGERLITLSFKDLSISQAKVKQYSKLTDEQKGQYSNDGTVVIKNKQYVIIDGTSLGIGYKAKGNKITVNVLDSNGKAKQIEFKKIGKTKLKVTKCTLKNGWRLSVGDVLQIE